MLRSFLRPDLSLGAACREIGLVGWSLTTKLPPLPFFGSRSSFNCHCLHRFHIVFGEVFAVILGLECLLLPLLILALAWLLALLRLPLALLFPPLPPPPCLHKLTWLLHLLPLITANMQHVSLSAVGVSCAVLKVAGLQHLPLFPPTIPCSQLH